MADLTFKEAYDADPTGGDTLLRDRTYLGCTYDTDGDGLNLVDKGFNLNQLKNAIDSPAFVEVQGRTGSNGLQDGVEREMTRVSVPAGFVEDTVFFIEITASITSATNPSNLRAYIEGTTPAASGDIINLDFNGQGLYRRCQVSVPALTQFSIPDPTEANSFGLQANPATVLYTAGVNNGFDIVFASTSQPDGGACSYQTISVLGYQAAAAPGVT